MNPLQFLDGWKTHLAALSLLALGIYQITQGQFEAGVQSVLGAAAAFGLRSAISKPVEVVPPPVEDDEVDK